MPDEDNKNNVVDNINDSSNYGTSSFVEASGTTVRQGSLHPLKTTREVSNIEEIVDFFVVGLPTKAVNGVLKALQQVLANKLAFEVQHLRRIVKHELLPAHLKQRLSPHHIKGSSHINENDHIATLASPADSEEHLHSQSEGSEPDFYLLVSPTTVVLLEELVTLLSNLSPSLGLTSATEVNTVPVPALAPTSEGQAKRLTEKYWPTVYNRNNPFGPHPSIYSRAAVELKPQIGRWMTLADRLARETKLSGSGENVGAVIVDRNNPSSGEVVVIAGDARWHGSSKERRPLGSGNVMAHAIMRAIGMVARKRRANCVPLEAEGLQKTDNGQAATANRTFLEYPLTPLEQEYYKQGAVAANGYLCFNLEIYVTHEPCIMCSMALLHSRFCRVIFGQRMPLTGGLTAETSTTRSPEQFTEPDIGGLGYGMFWRPELNWKLLAWQWKDLDPESLTKLDEITHA
ncbi:MAG: tRNA-specific adenosine deaminase subunit tad3 [Sclerophora amabilis]|nr:MAG: tRNA-specific adenosine deaminase subunit tad3 [Sclerophora amabilis]